MAKFFVTFMLLAIVALENNSIYNRLYAHAHPSYDTSDISSHHQQHHQQQQQQQLRQHHHRHLPHNSQHHSEHRTHRKRHAEHHQQAPTQPELRGVASPDRRHEVLPLDVLKSMPRLWQHLQQEENMYGDQPFSDSQMAEENDDELAFAPHSDMAAELRRHDAIMKVRNDLNEIEQLKEEEQQLKQQLLLSADDEVSPNSDDEDVDDGASENGVQDVDSIYNSKFNAMEGSTVAPVPKGCPKCESSRQVEHITEEELTRLRIEYVKQQILGKLRLKERPNVSAVRLPRPLYEGATIEHADDVSKDKELDDYYARTSKKFIFLEREKHECQRLSSPAMCFSFKIDDADADGFDVSTAVLWIFKNKHKRQHKQQRPSGSSNDTATLLEQQTIVVSEVQQQAEQQYLPVVKTIAIQTLDVQDEWMKIDIVWPIKRWFGNHELSHLIHISCESCDIESMDEIISVDKDYRPFIMIDTQNRRRQSRTKRSINCTDGVTECCREKLYISFDEIGWGNWIIQPRGYDAYFCRGSCSTLASVAQSSSHHHTFVQKLISSQQRNGRKPLELIPCCTAKQYSSLQLVFIDSNNTATQKTFPNLVVESCGCR